MDAAQRPSYAGVVERDPPVVTPADRKDRKRRMRTSKSLEATAYHEAGHAVAAWRLGVGFRKQALSIVPDGDSLGHAKQSNPLFRVDLEFDKSDRARRRAEKAAQISLAGGAAQRRFSARSYRHAHIKSDLHEAVHMLGYFAEGDELEAYLRLIEIRARHMFNRPFVWRCVQALAGALLARKKLSGREIKRIIEATVRPIAR